MLDEDSGYEARGHDESAPLSISQLTWYIKNLVEGNLPKLWVEGEISDLSRPSSGHLYFTLKDDQCQIRAVMWRSTAERLRFKLQDGQSVVCGGGVEVYAPRGTYQLIVKQVLPKGEGELQLAFRQLQQKLTAQGLFDESRKKPLPRFPRQIGFVTSPSGAAIHDFLEAANDRWSDFHLRIISSRVQGESAASDISRGIRLAQTLEPKLDLLIVGRGGGSTEDLWCFNEEKVVRAIAASNIPTISAVGHEIDVTLSDLAADARALTPTHAASLALPNRQEIATWIRHNQTRIDELIRNRLSRYRQQLEHYSQRSVLARPHALHQQRKQMVDESELRLHKTMRGLLQLKREKLASMSRATEALSPLAVLQRGYSLTQKAGLKTTPVFRSSEIEVGDLLQTTLSEGSVTSRVESISENTSFDIPKPEN